MPVEQREYRRRDSNPYLPHLKRLLYLTLSYDDFRPRDASDPQSPHHEEV